MIVRPAFRRPFVTGVFAPLPSAPFVFAEESKIQLNPFVHEALEEPHERLAFRIVKEQPILISDIRCQISEASTARRARLTSEI